MVLNEAPESVKTDVDTIENSTPSPNSSYDPLDELDTNLPQFHKKKNTKPFNPEDLPVFVDNYKYIPLRLSDEERRLLRVLENALEVCDYTDTVDVTFSHTKKSKLSRIIESFVDVLSIASGLVVSNDYQKGESTIGNHTIEENIPLFTQLFEVARRYKIMNPGKMRGTYGKLMYILMDTQSEEVMSWIKNSFVVPVITVYRYLIKHGGLEMLADPLLPVATGTLTGLTASKFDNAPLYTKYLGANISRKEAFDMLVEKYSNDQLTADRIQRVVESISDNDAYLQFNVTPVDKVIEILKSSFDPKKLPADPGFSLQLNAVMPKKYMSGSSFTLSGGSGLAGRGGGGNGYSSSYFGSGACLTHDHATQFTFVLQSFTLWREIMFNMPKLWVLADEDITHETYRLVDTGQGKQRLQGSPRVRQEMNRILGSVQQTTGCWVGLSVVHLGDRDVPNALIFIDKYTQVSRILVPIVRCIEQLPLLVNDKAFHSYVAKEWGSIDGLRMQILSDFFKHGFDGSGDDGGSCIDGRLTSAWNWCSKLHKKPYYHVFMFTGFQGFDGDWKEN